MPRFEPHPHRRTAVVTGASSGIGRATACVLGAAGHPVVLGARRHDRCEEAAEEIRGQGGDALALTVDVTDDASVAAFAAEAERTMGPVEVLVSNAGEVRPQTVVDADPREFARQVEVNLLGAQRLVHHLVPAMLERRRGDVVFVTSEVTRVPRPHMAGYVTAKWGLEGLARAMQMELEGRGVRVGMVRPGPSATEQGLDWTSAEVDAVLGEWSRWGVLRHEGYLRAADVAAAVHTMISAPRGTHLTLLEVEPEAPG